MKTYTCRNKHLHTTYIFEHCESIRAVKREADYFVCKGCPRGRMAILDLFPTPRSSKLCELSKPAQNTPTHPRHTDPKVCLEALGNKPHSGIELEQPFWKIRNEWAAFLSMKIPRLGVSEPDGHLNAHPPVVLHNVDDPYDMGRKHRTPSPDATQI